MSATGSRTLTEEFTSFVRSWLRDQVPLMEAFFVAVSFHVIMLPAVWVVGWALPWPKSPVITTIIEFDLTKWPPKPKKVINFRDPKLNN